MANKTKQVGGKWVNGMDGRLSPKYKARRKKRTQMAKKSRSRNRRPVRGKR